MKSLPPVLEIHDLSFRYHSDLPVIENVNVQIREGESACIVGPNGGGKSTLLKLILGLLQPDSGTIRVFGVPPQEACQKIGYMPQYLQLDTAFPITALEVVLMGRIHSRLFFRYSRNDLKTAMESLNELGISHLAKQSFASLSGGQRQRVLIARALTAQPKLLLLDEPTANIDPGAEEQFYATLDCLRKRMTIITVSHDLGFVNRETDLIICVNRQAVTHHAADFTAETADQIYHHHVSLIQHDHSCFCHCGEKEAVSHE